MGQRVTEQATAENHKTRMEGWKHPPGTERADSGTRGGGQRDLGQKAMEIYSQKKNNRAGRQARNLRREGGVTSETTYSTVRDREQLNS